MTFEIRYYLTQVAYKSGVPAFKETINGPKYYAVKWAQNRCKSSKFLAYDLIQK